MAVKERIAKLRELMERDGIDIYMVPTADFHNSEYVGEHFKARVFMSGFSSNKRLCWTLDRWSLLLTS